MSWDIGVDGMIDHSEVVSRSGPMCHHSNWLFASPCLSYDPTCALSFWRRTSSPQKWPSRSLPEWGILHGISQTSFSPRRHSGKEGAGKSPPLPLIKPTRRVLSEPHNMQISTQGVVTCQHPRDCPRPGHHS